MRILFVAESLSLSQNPGLAGAVVALAPYFDLVNVHRLWRYPQCAVTRLAQCLSLHKEVLSAGCGRVVDNSASQLAQTLSNLLGWDCPTRTMIGQRDRKLVELVYAWLAIADQMCGLYHSLMKSRLGVRQCAF